MQAVSRVLTLSSNIQYRAELWRLEWRIYIFSPGVTINPTRWKIKRMMDENGEGKKEEEEEEKGLGRASIQAEVFTLIYDLLF